MEKVSKATIKLSIRLTAVRLLAEDILNQAGKSQSDERIKPELRDVVRIADGKKPLTIAGKSAMSVASGLSEG
jgi:hypothetical protein